MRQSDGGHYEAAQEKQSDNKNFFPHVATSARFANK
jgi:hypothetical protein